MDEAKDEYDRTGRSRVQGSKADDKYANEDVRDRRLGTGQAARASGEISKRRNRMAELMGEVEAETRRARGEK